MDGSIAAISRKNFMLKIKCLIMLEEENGKEYAH